MAANPLRHSDDRPLSAFSLRHVGSLYRRNRLDNDSWVFLRILSYFSVMRIYSKFMAYFISFYDGRWGSRWFLWSYRLWGLSCIQCFEIILGSCLSHIRRNSTARCKRYKFSVRW